MKKNVILFIITLFMGVGVHAQRVVENYSDVKKPKNGKLYFSEKENKLSIYTNGKFELIKDVDKGIVKPPIVQPPTEETTIVGYWSIEERILKVRKYGEKYWLIQTDPDETYIVARGANILDRGDTKFYGNFDRSKIASNASGIGGLQQPDNFPEDILKNLGYSLKSNGEWVKGETPKPVEGVFNVPVGVINWPSWFTTLVPDDPIDVTKETRYGLSNPESDNQAPWFATYTANETILKHKYNTESDRWEYSPVTVNVTLNGDRAGVMEQEIAYASDAGISYFLFCYYSPTYPTPTNIAPKQFEAVADKKGVKAAFIAMFPRNDNEYYDDLKVIGDKMRQSWYQRIDGKPILVLMSTSDEKDIQEQYYKYLDIKKAYGQGELYTIIMIDTAEPDFCQRVIDQYGYNAFTKYATAGGWGGGNSSSHAKVIEEEKRWYAQASKVSVDFVPNTTISYYRLGALYSWDDPSWPWAWSTKATNAQINEQLNQVKAYSNGEAKVKTVIAYSWNEYTEGGRTVSPQKRRDGSIDRDILDLFRLHIKGY